MDYDQIGEKVTGELKFQKDGGIPIVRSLTQFQAAMMKHLVHSARDSGYEQQHTTMEIERDGVVVGSVEVWVCTRCLLPEVRCTHSKNSWNKDGTELTCDLCGVDGT